VRCVRSLWDLSRRVYSTLDSLGKPRATRDYSSRRSIKENLETSVSLGNDHGERKRGERNVRWCTVWIASAGSFYEAIRQRAIARSSFTRNRGTVGRAVHEQNKPANYRRVANYTWRILPAPRQLILLIKHDVSQYGPRVYLTRTRH